ncbi:MAG: protein kinase [Xanthomonadales bacterium]|nr:protein kinase [Xanthomonadales bacterium]
MSRKIENWKQANAIYKTLDHLPLDDALKAVSTLEDVPAEITQIIIQLIKAAQTTNEYVHKQLIDIPQLNDVNDHKLNPGDQMDQYELLEEIGRGGMSIVYRAHRLHAENQKPVAIKVFSGIGQDTKLHQHFIAEQQILSNLTHPNIITMHHGGTTPQGVSFLVMELLQGAKNIDDYAAANKLTDKTIIGLVLQAAEAISYAHSQLVIHRDIKPSNLLISQSGELRVVDFGIAKLIEQEQVNDQNTILALTPSYASPEQVNGQHISVQTDVFSLAVVAVRLLNGKSPFSMDRAIKSCAQDEQQIEQALKNKKIDSDLHNILNKALKTNPALRYTSMQQFADDLSAWLKHEPVSATPDSLFYHIKKFAARRTALFASLLTLFLTLSAAIFILSWQYNKIKIEAAKAEAVKNFMLNAFESTDPDVHGGEKISAHQLLNTAAKKLSQGTDMDKNIKFDLLQTIGIAYSKLGDFDSAQKYIKQSLNIKADNGQSLSYLAQILFEQAEYDELKNLIETANTSHFQTEELARLTRAQARLMARNAEFNQAIEMVNHLNATSPSLDYILNQQLLAELYFYQSKPELSILTLEHLLADTKIDPKLSSVMDLSKDLAEYYLEVGDYQHALTTLDDLINTQKQLLGEIHPTVAKTTKLLGSAYMHNGDMQQAQKLLEQSFTLNTQIFGEHSVQTAYDLNTLAVISHQEGDLARAINYMKQAVQIFEQQKALDNTDNLEIKTNLASLLNINDQSDEAKTILQEVLSVQQEKLGETHDSTLYTKKNLAYTLSKLGEHQAAITLINQTTEEALRNYDIKHPLIASLIYNQAKIYQNNQQTREALNKFLEIIDKQLLQTTQPLYSKTLKAIAYGYELLDDFDNAQKYYLQCIENRLQLFGQNHLRTLEIQIPYTELLVKHQHFDHAQKTLKTMINSIETMGLQDHAYMQNIQQLLTQYPMLKP